MFSLLQGVFSGAKAVSFWGVGKTMYQSSNLAKRYYFTNLNVPEKYGEFPLLFHKTIIFSGSFGRVFGGERKDDQSFKLTS